MIPQDKQYTNLNEKLPELRAPRDPIAEAGRILSILREELQPRSDMKYWR